VRKDGMRGRVVWAVDHDAPLFRKLLEPSRSELGDQFLTYAGTSDANSGPSDIAYIANVNQHCGFNGVHLNGGQNLHVAFNREIDCAVQPEVDSGTLQYINSYTITTMSE
jgi:hypothetical protein